MNALALNLLPPEVFQLVLREVNYHNVTKLWITGNRSIQSLMKRGGVLSFNSSDKPILPKVIAQFDSLLDLRISWSGDHQSKLERFLKRASQSLQSLEISTVTPQLFPFLRTRFNRLTSLDTGSALIPPTDFAHLPPTLTCLKTQVLNFFSTNLPIFPSSLTDLQIRRLWTSNVEFEVKGVPELLSLEITVDSSTAPLSRIFFTTLPPNLTKLAICNFSLPPDAEVMQQLPSQLQWLEIPMSFTQETISALPRHLTCLKARVIPPTEIGPEEVACLPSTLTSLHTDLLQLLPGAGALLPPLLRSLLVDTGGPDSYPYEIVNAIGYNPTSSSETDFKRELLPSSLTNFVCTDHRPEFMMPVLPDGLTRLDWGWMRIHPKMPLNLPNSLLDLTVTLNDIRVHDWKSWSTRTAESWITAARDSPEDYKLILPSKITKLSVVLHNATPLVSLLPPTLISLELSSNAESACMYPDHWGMLLPRQLQKLVLSLPSAAYSDEWVRMLDLRHLLHLSLAVRDVIRDRGMTPASLSDFPKTLTHLSVQYIRPFNWDGIDLRAFSSLRYLDIEAGSSPERPNKPSEFLPPLLTELLIPGLNPADMEQDQMFEAQLRKMGIRLLLKMPYSGKVAVMRAGQKLTL